ncbi:HAD-IC family P-type ATPase [Microbacterium sp. RU33B]|uniref:HAD-IC family P-type ATPase n=1 Tax=Microbacterium sp. RU33B TaxID=1907390 RepID=UPI0009615AF1|nr:HAD-IC family P-type ATPase [Microbacterium sp. RU33B]SIT68739.1 cation-transporting ATPase E [Microbacterium sp. RU33B]
MDAPATDFAPSGLTPAEVAERVAAGKTNAFTADTSRSAWNIVRANVFTLFNGIVFACFFVLFLVGRWQDALFGFAAFGNAIIGCVQEFKAKAALDKLALLNAPHARVLRSGQEQEILPGEVVLDDILVLRAGDQVPADAEIVSGRGLQIDESMLTGESDAVDKHPGDEALSGSIVVGGEGTARVSRVGADSYANRFAGEAKRFSMVSSELRTSINRVLTWVSWGIGPIALLVFNAQVMVAGGYTAVFTTGAWVQAVVNTIASVTAMVPLGLVLMTSIAFAVGAAKLASRQVLVNELPAVEGLARVDIICLDKTGTLTIGEIAFDGAHPLSGSVDGWEGVLAWYAASPDANATARAMRTTYAAEASDPAAYIPFSSARKWSAVSLSGTPGTWVMGAPEMVFGDAATDSSTEFGRSVTTLAETGRRTLVLAHSATALSDADVEAERLPDGVAPAVVLTFREQVRPDAAQTLEYFRTQGVGVRIISGDNPRTVAAIAREVGLDVAEGFDARRLPDDEAELAEVLERNQVFGRVTPEQKKNMVTALQSRGHTVAMTGDGVNDALAIKTADIGIAMNSGSPATKAVARLVLLDGQFSHLPDVVAEGRQVIANIERVSMLFLTKTVYATGLAILFGILVLEFPFLPRQLSITDGLTIGIPAFFLALMPNKQRYIPGFLRRSLTFAIPAGAIIALGLTWYTFVAKGQDVSEEQLRTGATIILAIVGIWVLSVLSRPLNRFKVLVVGAMFIALVGVFTIPLATQFFALVDPGPDLAVALTGISIVMIGAIEVVRFVHRRLVARLLPQETTPAAEARAAAADRAPAPAVSAVLITIVAVLVYAAGFLATAFGILVLLARYEGADAGEVLWISLAGSAIALFGLLVVASASGVRRGSGLSRLLLTIYLGLLVVLELLIIASSDSWDWPAIGIGVVAIAMIVVLWTPPVARTFGRVRESSMNAQPVQASRS